MKNNFSYWDVFFYFFVAIIIALSFLNYSIELHHEKLEFFFDSDVLYLHRLFMDVFFLKHHFLSWYSPQATYIFPDMLLFFIAEILLCQKIFFVIILFAILQYLLFIYITQKIASVALEESAINVKSLIYVVLLITLVSLVIPGKDCFRFAIESVYHFGAFINGLIFVLLLLYSLKKPSSQIIPVIIGCFSLVSFISDPSFLTQFLAPALFIMIIFRSQVPLVKICLYLLCGVFFGLLLRYCFIKFVHLDYMYFDPFHLWTRLRLMYQTIPSSMLSRHWFLGSLTLLFYGLLLFQAIVYRTSSVCVRFLRLFILTSVVSTLVSVALFETNGSIFQRYMLNFYYYPIVFCWLPIIALAKQPVIARLFKVSLFVAVIIITGLTIKASKKFRFEYYPPLVSCIDKRISDYNLTHAEKIKYGIANYWQAGVISSLSKQNLHVAEYSNFLLPHYSVNTSEAYKKHYDFAVIALPRNFIQTQPKNILDIKLIEQINGKPIIEFTCNNEAIIMIYGKNKLTLRE